MSFQDGGLYGEALALNAIIKAVYVCWVGVVMPSTVISSISGPPTHTQEGTHKGGYCFPSCFQLMEFAFNETHYAMPIHTAMPQLSSVLPACSLLHKQTK